MNWGENKMGNFWDKAKGWIAGIVGAVGAALSAIPMPLPAKIITTSVCAGIPLVIGIVELVRAIIRRRKGKKATTITEAALASDADVDAGDATTAYRKAVKRQGKAYFNEFKKDRKSKKSKSKKASKFKYDSKKKKSKKTKKSHGEVLSLYDIARDAIIA